ncbi:inverse autotransporter beta domain-containing protein [Jeongeupia wiesaeckerbachi]|uniref:inverse autotransporter beta domain-containing protein n=1 Tax=Jeongeupia wiesaeckerbachi TaxID=3051218 RepID=UPI003D8068ED
MPSLRCLILLLLAGPASAADAPFVSDAAGSSLPDIGSSIQHEDGEAALASMAEQSLVAGQYGWRATLLDRTGSGLETLFDQYGQARIHTQLDEEGRLGDASADLLLPIDATGPQNRFAQFGVRHDGERAVSNIGIVQRVQHGAGLSGYSAFVDRDLGGDTTRIGFGASNSSDYLRLAINTYLPVGGRGGADERSERAARGFDLNAQAHLPAWPQLGGSVRFERYHGDDISLPGSDTAHDNPSAVSASLQYTPVPLLSFGAHFRRDDNDERDWQLQATLSYQFGVPLDKQLRSSDAKPSLPRRDNDFVDRNGSVARQSSAAPAPAPAFSASLSADQAATGQPGSATLTVTSRQPIVSLAWIGDGAALLTSAGTSPLLGRSGILSARVKLALPADGHGYTLAARIVDSNGNAVVTPAIQLRAAPVPMQNGADGPV